MGEFLLIETTCTKLDSMIQLGIEVVRKESTYF